MQPSPLVMRTIYGLLVSVLVIAGYAAWLGV
jgi:hypothetical protein